VKVEKTVVLLVALIHLASALLMQVGLMKPIITSPAIPAGWQVAFCVAVGAVLAFIYVTESPFLTGLMFAKHGVFGWLAVARIIQYQNPVVQIFVAIMDFVTALALYKIATS